MEKRLPLIAVLAVLCLFSNAQTILGVDVSHYDSDVPYGAENWAQVKGAGKKFAWNKATQGTGYTDPSFVTNMVGGHSAGVVMGAYHFATPESNSATAEANWFVSVAGAYIGPGYLPPVLDLEDPSTGTGLTSYFTSAALTTWVQTWMTTVQNATGVAPIIYTSGSIASYVGSSLNHYGLWSADPDGSSTIAPNAAHLGAWTTWQFKQYSWTGTVAGIGSNSAAQVDLDVFNGDSTAFNTLIGVSTTTTAGFTANVTTGCPGMQVTFTDHSTSTGTITGHQWTITGGSPGTSTATNPVVIYNASGNYSVKEVVISSTGTDSITKTAYIHVIPDSTLPLVQTFQGSTFPPAGWTMNFPSPADSAWQLCTNNGYNSTHCMYFPANCGYVASTAGQRQQLYTPNYSFVGTSNPIMWFDVAYEPYNRVYSDTLAVYYSLDCSNTWNLIYLKGGMTLCTTGSTDSAGVDTSGGRGCFIPPNSNAWRADTINLSSLMGDADVMFSFESRSGWGNILYIDNINVASPVVCTPPATPTIQASPGTTACSTVQLTASSSGCTGCTYSWSNSATGSVISVTSTGTYHVTATSAGCASLPATVAVTVNQPPTVLASPSTQQACINQAVTLTASGNGTSFQWGGTGLQSSTGSSVSAVVSSAGSQTYTVTATLNGCTATANTSVNFNAPPATPSITPSPGLTACGAIQLTASSSGCNGCTYNWSNGASGAVISVTASATYTVTTTSGSCISSPGSVAVTVNQAPTVLASASSQQVCVNQSVTLTATGNGTSYQWSGTGLQTNTGNNVNALVSTVGGQTYTVIASLNGCTGTASTTVNFATTVAPTVTISQTTTGPICNGTSVSFSASGTNGGTSPVYQWSAGNGQTGAGNTFTLNNVANGVTVRCLLISNAGCASPDSVYSNTLTVATQAPQPATLNISTPDTNVCSGENIAFTSVYTNGGNSPAFNWFVNGTSQGSGSTFTLNNIQSTSTVYCVMTSSSACVTGSPVASNTMNIRIQNSAVASVSIAANANPVCAGAPVVFTATPGNGGSTPIYAWQLNGNAVGSNSSSYSYSGVQNGDVISCLMTSSASCVGTPNVVSNTVTMAVSPLPVANAGNSFYIPSSSSVILGGNPSASGGTSPYTYVWNPQTGLSSGSAANPIESGITNSTIYTLSVTDAHGCTATDTVGVYLIQCTLAAPTVQLNACDLAAQNIPAVNYQWYLQGSTIAGATTRFYTVTQAGYYFVKVSDLVGCTAQSPDAFVSYPACLSTGIEDVYDMPVFDVYPNPATNEVTVSFIQTVSGNARIEIIDLVGQTIYSNADINASTGFKYTINTGAIAAGPYLIRVTNAEGKFTVRSLIKM